MRCGIEGEGKEKIKEAGGESPPLFPEAKKWDPKFHSFASNDRVFIPSRLNYPLVPFV